MAKIGANDPCPCGSGKKYKQCCRKQALSQQPTRERTRLSWESLLLAPPQEQPSLAAMLLQEKGFSPQTTEAWVALAQIAKERSAPHLSQLAFAQGQQVAATPQDHWSLAYLALELEQVEWAWEIVEKHLPAEEDREEAHWMVRGQLLMLKQRWEEAASLWEKQITQSPKASLFWRWVGCLRHTKLQDTLETACQRAQEATQDPIWPLYWANALTSFRQDQQAHKLHATHFLAALQFPHQSTDPSEKLRRESALFEAAILYLPLLEKTEREIFLRILRKRPTLSSSECHRLRSELCVVCEAWDELAQEAQQWNAHETSPKARWLAQFASLLLQSIPPQNKRPQKVLEPPQELPLPAFWDAWPTSLQHTILQALLKAQCDALAPLLFARLQGTQDPQQRLLWTLHQAQQEAWEKVASSFLSDSSTSTPQLALLHALSLLRTQGPQAAKAPFEAIATNEQTDLAISTQLWRAEIAYLLNEDRQGLDLLDEISTKTPASQLPKRFWTWRALFAARQQDHTTFATAMQAIFAQAPTTQNLEAATRALLLVEAHDEALALLQRNRSRVRWDESLSWLLACCAFSSQHWALASGALQTIDQTWLSKQQAQEQAWSMRALSACFLGAWLEALESCEQWQQSIESKAAGLSRETSPSNHTNKDEVFARPPDQAKEARPSYPSEEMLPTLHHLRRIAAQGLLQETKHPSSRSLDPYTTTKKTASSASFLETLSLPAMLQNDIQEKLFQSLHKAQTQHLQQTLQDAQHTELSILSPDPLLPSLANAQEEQHYLDLLGDDLWMQLPEGTRKTFISAERLWSLLEREEDADHAPLFLQWMRGLEALLNLHLVDSMVRFAEQRLGLHTHRDLPRLGGRLLQSQGNQIGLGSLPFLLADQWEKPDPENEKDDVMYNFQVTAGQQLLWAAWERHLTETRPPKQVAFLQQRLPSLCAKLAHLRAQAAHATTPLSRAHLASLREELFFQKDAQLLPSLARPLFGP